LSAMGGADGSPAAGTGAVGGRSMPKTASEAGETSMGHSDYLGRDHAYPNASVFFYAVLLKSSNLASSRVDCLLLVDPIVLGLLV